MKCYYMCTYSVYLCLSRANFRVCVSHARAKCTSVLVGRYIYRISCLVALNYLVVVVVVVVIYIYISYVLYALIKLSQLSKTRARAPQGIPPLYTAPAHLPPRGYSVHLHCRRV